MKNKKGYKPDTGRVSTRATLNVANKANSICATTSERTTVESVVQNFGQGGRAAIRILGVIAILFLSFFSNLISAQNCFTSNFNSDFDPKVYVLCQNTACSTSASLNNSTTSLSLTYVTPNASSLINAINGNNTNNIIANKQLLFSAGVLFDVNTDISFVNCIMIFEQGAEMEVSNSIKLKIEACTLKGGCNSQLWKGISAVGTTVPLPQTQLQIVNCPIISDMSQGIKLSSNPNFYCANNTFTNNWSSIFYDGCNYSATTGSTNFVQNNDFNTVTGMVAIPSGTISKGRIGIDIRNCQDITIGAITSATTGNRFDNLQAGIRTYTTNSALNANIRIFNARFSNITDLADTV